MTLTIDLSQDQERVIREVAQRRGVAVEEIAREAILAYTARVDEATFRHHAQASVRENSELLRRLA